jgi:ADP-heptose:LPS heptosyltransferase
MGYGDAIMASGQVRGFHSRGKLAAFGDGKTIRWTGYCDDIFANNPNIARPGAERQPNIIWFPHYKKHHAYLRNDGQRYIWNYDFRAQPGELFFGPEDRLPLPINKSFIMIEPNAAWQRAISVNKDWGEGKFEAVAKALIDRGYTIVQCIHGNSRRIIPGAYQVPTPTLRQAIQIMSGCSLYIGSEGAGHHAAAAVNIPAVIIWGGWSPTQTMGYKNLIMLTGNSKQACGNTVRCSHCRSAFDSISVEEVYQAAIKEFDNGRQSSSGPIRV